MPLGSYKTTVKGEQYLGAMEHQRNSSYLTLKKCSRKAGTSELAFAGWQNHIQWKTGKERVSGNRTLNANTWMITHSKFRILCSYRNTRRMYMD